MSLVARQLLSRFWSAGSFNPNASRRLKSRLQEWFVSATSKVGIITATQLSIEAMLSIPAIETANGDLSVRQLLRKSKSKNAALASTQSLCTNTVGTGQIFSLVLLCAFTFLAKPDCAGQEEFLVPDDHLYGENLPKIPMSLVRGTSRYTARSAAVLSWHPIRREMLVCTRFGDTYGIHLVKFPGCTRTQLTFFKDQILEASIQPVEGEYFVFSKDSKGDENYQKYRYDFGTGAITLLTDGKSRNTDVLWSHSGDGYIYGSTRRNGRDVDLWIMDPRNPKSDRMLVQLQGEGWAALDISPDDRQLLLSEFLSVSESYLWLLDIASGKRTLITPKIGDETVSYQGGMFTKDGMSVYAITDRDSEFLRLAKIELATKKHSYICNSIKWDVDCFNISWDRKTIAFSVNEDGLSVLHLLDIISGKEIAAPRLPTGLTFPSQWHKNNSDLAFVFTSSSNPQDCYSFDVNTGKVERWTKSETGGADMEHFSKSSIVHWKSFDGKIISGLLYLPPARFTGKRPVIISIHGGPEAQARPWFQGENNYLINELGIVVIQPNVRGSSGYGKTFLQLDNGFRREDTYKDIGSMLDWIKTQPDLDSNRIMVTGNSYGGYMALSIAAFYPDRIRCALDVVGPSNLATFLENTSTYRQDLRRCEYGDERDPKMREFLNRIAPSNNAEKIRKPIFVVQGGNDPRVPVSESMQIVSALRSKGTPVWYLMAKDEGHGFAKKKNREYLFYYTVLFIGEHLLK